MNKIFIALILLMLITQPAFAQNNTFEYQVASKLLGENNFTEENFTLLVCTVKNRLDKGWSKKYVLNAYSGISKPPKEEEVIFVKNTLDNKNCPPVYFAFSEEDMTMLNKDVKPLYNVDGILYFSYEQYKELVSNK